jgi:hypothetical protein
MPKYHFDHLAEFRRPTTAADLCNAICSSYGAIFHWPLDVRHQLKLYSCGGGFSKKETANLNA